MKAAVFCILRNKAFQPVSTCIIVVTRHIIRYAYENVNFSSFFYLPLQIHIAGISRYG
jgi:hypothetical protein